MAIEPEVLIRKQQDFIRYYMNENKRLMKEIKSLNEKIEDLKFQLEDKECIDMINNARRRRNNDRRTSEEVLQEYRYEALSVCTRRR